MYQSTDELFDLTNEMFFNPKFTNLEETDLNSTAEFDADNDCNIKPRKITMKDLLKSKSIPKNLKTTKRQIKISEKFVLDSKTTKKSIARLYTREYYKIKLVIESNLNLY